MVTPRLNTWLPLPHKSKGSLVPRGSSPARTESGCFWLERQPEIGSPSLPGFQWIPSCNQSKKLKKNSEANQSTAPKGGQSLDHLYQMNGATSNKAQKFWLARPAWTWGHFIFSSAPLLSLMCSWITIQLPAQWWMSINKPPPPPRPSWSWDTASTGKFCGRFYKQPLKLLEQCCPTELSAMLAMQQPLTLSGSWALWNRTSMLHKWVKGGLHVLALYSLFPAGWNPLPPKAHQHQTQTFTYLVI